MSRPPVLALVGPTGSGKSRLALSIARGRPIEIVAVDAFTVYRGLDVGTAKPDLDALEAVPHHLVDVLDPDREVTVAWFQAQARTAIDDIRRRGRTPLLVGGSGLYFRAVVDDLRFPPTDAVVRARLERRWSSRPDAAHRHLERLDPAAASRIAPANLRRTIRALEVIEVTGTAFSSYADAWQRYDSIYPSLDVAYLEPMTADLRARIERRAKAMAAGGLLEEAAALHASGMSRTARQAIGYAEAIAVLRGRLAEDDLAAAIAHRTWRYARRQRSWFRRDPRCTPTPPSEVLARFSVEPSTAADRRPDRTPLQ